MTTISSAVPAAAGTARSLLTWGAGDYARIALGFTPGAAAFVGRIGIAPGARVLDAACGTGNCTLAAAYLGGAVTALDLVPALLDRAREAAAAQRLRVRFDVGDCAELPYGDASFDVVLSMFGVMFSADPLQSAAELLRACRPGGRIALANWTPEGFIGTLFRRMARHLPPRPAGASPLDWGRELVVPQYLRGVRDLAMTRRTIALHWPFPPEQVALLFRACYGPAVHAYAALAPAARERMHDDLVALWREHSRSPVGGTYVEAEYLEVMAVR